MTGKPRRAEGFLKPVDYSRRTPYRRPPGAYLRLQWLGPLLTALGATPKDVRAAGGRVVIGRKQRHAATLAEVPPRQRAPVIRAYLLRWGRRAGSRAVAREARHYFGVSADPSLEDIEAIAERYPVFRIRYDGHQDTAAGPATGSST